MLKNMRLTLNHAVLLETFQIGVVLILTWYFIAMQNLTLL